MQNININYTGGFDNNNFLNGDTSQTVYYTISANGKQIVFECENHSNREYNDGESVWAWLDFNNAATTESNADILGISENQLVEIMESFYWEQREIVRS